MAEDHTEQLSPLDNRVRELAMSAPNARYLESPFSSQKVPEQFDLTTFPEGYAQTDVQQLLDFSRDFVKYHIYTNEFPTHGERASWEEEKLNQIASEFGDEGRTIFNQFISRENKIPRGIISNFEPLSVFIEMDGVYDQMPEQLQQIRNIIADKISTHDIESIDPNTGLSTFETIDPWQIATTEEKIQTVNEVTELVMDLLNRFATKQ